MRPFVAWSNLLMGGPWEPHDCGSFDNGTVGTFMGSDAWFSTFFARAAKRNEESVSEVCRLLGLLCLERRWVAWVSL